MCFFRKKSSRILLVCPFAKRVRCTVLYTVVHLIAVHTANYEVFYSKIILRTVLIAGERGARWSGWRKALHLLAERRLKLFRSLVDIQARSAVLAQ